MGLIRLILIFIAIYMAVKYIIRPLLRVFLQRTIQKAVEREMGRMNNSGRPQRKEGSIHVDYIPKDEKRPNGGSGNKGEYIDYEEVK